MFQITYPPPSKKKKKKIFTKSIGCRKMIKKKKNPNQKRVWDIRAFESINAK